MKQVRNLLILDRMKLTTYLNFSGKVCPNTTARVLGHKLPPSDRPETTESAANKGKR